jgi:hypothetical protein
MTPPNQSLRRKAYCRIVVEGNDVTDRMRPYLISVRAVDKSEGWGMRTSSWTIATLHVVTDGRRNDIKSAQVAVDRDTVVE